MLIDKVYLFSGLLCYIDIKINNPIKNRVRLLWWSFLGKIKNGVLLWKFLLSYYTTLEKSNMLKITSNYWRENLFSILRQKNISKANSTTPVIKNLLYPTPGALTKVCAKEISSERYLCKSNESPQVNIKIHKNAMSKSL